MMRNRLDAETASRLLSGSVHPDDAPPGFGKVAALLYAASDLGISGDTPGPPAAGPGAPGEAATVAAMVEAIREAPVPLRPSRRRMVARVLSVKVAAAVGTLALTTGGAAAATGSLPDSIQDAVSEAVSHVGIDVPSADNEHANVGGKSGDPHGKSDGPHGQSDEPHGQSGDPHGNSEGDTPEESSGKGGTVSDMVHDELTGEPKGPVVSEWTSGGQSQAGENGTGGAPAETPAVDGRALADDASGGASTAGPENAQRP